jgi:hypothetical protein
MSSAGKNRDENIDISTIDHHRLVRKTTINSLADTEYQRDIDLIN